MTTTIAWTFPSTYAETGVHHGYRTAPGDITDLHAHYGEVLPGSVVFVSKVWWGMLEPGGFIVPHIDASPWYRRWHYPIEPAGYVWHDETLLISPAAPFEIRHYEPHAVWNPTDKRRVHLIVETGEQVPGDSPLVLCDMTEEIQDLIDAISD